MSVLLLRLSGPLQSWGSRSRFSRRLTEAQPTKSGVLGLLAAAQGRRRTDSIEDLLELSFGVRIDQPGTIVRDFQTARSLDGKDSMPLSERYYLADAVFLAAIEGDADLVAGFDAALRAPTFPLYLGRRSCPPAGPVTLGVRPGTVREALKAEGWAAARHHQRATASPRIRLEIVLDAEVGIPWTESYQDTPLSFDPERRAYALRGVVRDETFVDNPAHQLSPDTDDAGESFGVSQATDSPHVPGCSAVPAPLTTRPAPDQHEPFSALGDRKSVV